MSSPPRSRTTEALVLKYRTSGEADRLVTLLSREEGKLVCVAKGVRKSNSTRAALLEPGNIIKCQLVTTHAMPILTQANLISDCLPIRSQLPKFRQLFQVLEMVDALFVEESIEGQLFEQVMDIRGLIVQTNGTPSSIKQKLEELVADLGYQPLSETSFSSLSQYVSSLVDKPLKSWDYLLVK